MVVLVVVIVLLLISRAWFKGVTGENRLPLNTGVRNYIRYKCKDSYEIWGLGVVPHMSILPHIFFLHQPVEIPKDLVIQLYCVG